MNALEKIRAERRWMQDHPGKVLDETPETFVQFRVEPFSEAAEEASKYFDAHHAEAGDSIPLRVNYDAYALMERLGTLQFVTARVSGMLVGYHSSFVSPSLKCSGALVGSMDMFYLAPEYRLGMIGYQLISFAVRKLEERGVGKIVTGVKPRHEPIFERLGFTPSERVFTKVV